MPNFSCQFSSSPFRQVVILCCFLVLPWPAVAVQQLPSDWPAAPANVDTNGFALILGGGGARGIAHIGVIEVLEELGMRPSLIVGTSMGAVVGGLYASGMSAAELKELALGEALLDLVVEVETPPAELQGGWWGPAPHQISLQINHWPPLPDTGVSRGQGFESLMGERTGDALFIAGNNFDNLPIAFRCVSTDLLENDRITISYIPGQGTTVKINVETKGTIPGSDFMQALWAIWLGANPVDGGMKDGMLGK